MKSIVTILLLIMCGYLSAQKGKIDSLKKLGRDSLIKLAIIKAEPGFDPKGYDRVIVKAFNDKLIVEFLLSITLIDGTCFYDYVSIALVGSGSGRGIEGDCDEPKYHKYTDKRKKKIQFVLNAINKSDEVGNLKNNQIPSGAHMTITEKLTYYHVDMDDWSTHSSYKVDKLTGNISDASHKHYAHSSDEKDNFEIIK